MEQRNLELEEIRQELKKMTFGSVEEKSYEVGEEQRKEQATEQKSELEGLLGEFSLRKREVLESLSQGKPIRVVQLARTLELAKRIDKVLLEEFLEEREPIFYQKTLELLEKVENLEWELSELETSEHTFVCPRAKKDKEVFDFLVNSPLRELFLVWFEKKGKVTSEELERLAKGLGGRASGYEEVLERIREELERIREEVRTEVETLKGELWQDIENVKLALGEQEEEVLEGVLDREIKSNIELIKEGIVELADRIKLLEDKPVSVDLSPVYAVLEDVKEKLSLLLERSEEKKRVSEEERREVVEEKTEEEPKKEEVESPAMLLEEEEGEEEKPKQEQTKEKKKKKDLVSLLKENLAWVVAGLMLILALVIWLLK